MNECQWPCLPYSKRSRSSREQYNKHPGGGYIHYPSATLLIQVIRVLSFPHTPPIRSISCINRCMGVYFHSEDVGVFMCTLPVFMCLYVVFVEGMCCVHN